MVYVRSLMLIVSRKRGRVTAPAFIVPVRDLFIIQCNTCFLVVIFLVKVVCKSIAAILTIDIRIALNHKKCY